MKKVAILGTRGIPARYGGFETFAEQLAIRLAARGIDVTVFCPTPRRRPSESYRGVTLRFVPFPHVGKYSEMIWDGRCFIEACSRYDVVYMLGLGGAYAAWIPRLFGAEVWINTDGLEWKRTKFKWHQRLYLALAEAMSVIFATRIIADAATIASYLCKRYPGLKQVSTIPYGADVPAECPDRRLIEEWNLQVESYYILVCRLEPENHVLEIIRGFELSKSSLSLVIVGDVEMPNRYVRELIDHRSNKVRFLGSIYNREKLAALRFFARAYIHGHSVGGTNPSLLEAMACSNAVIAHDNAFNREVLRDQGLFFLNPVDLADVIDSIDSRRVDLHRLRVASVTTIRERYQWDRVAQSYLECLKQ